MSDNVREHTIEECRDTGRIRTLASRCYMDAYREIHTEEQNRFSFEEMYSEESLKRQIEEQHSSFLILNDGNKDLGYAAFCPLGEHCWLLDKLYVLPDCKGMGYGRMLLDEVVRQISAEEKTAFLMRLKVNRRNRAVEFYHHMGFHITGQWDVEIAGGRWIMDGYDMERSCNRSILVSACLLGENCKYNGGNNRCQKVIDFVRGHRVTAVCPEQLGGLPTPRVPAEICGGRVMTREGRDVDNEFRKGAEAALQIARGNDVELAILQPRSPSCGCREVYDGSFTRTLVPGMGVFARFLADSGIRAVEPDGLEDMI